jgi:hypothetical protein
MLQRRFVQTTLSNSNAAHIEFDVQVIIASEKQEVGWLCARTPCAESSERKLAVLERTIGPNA